MASRAQKILVLNVDRDDDLGRKAGLATPVVGRDNCLEAGRKLMLADPEEADGNAIYAAVSEFDRLREKGYECEVAVLTGTHEGGFESDQKMLKEAKSLVSALRPEGILLVTDGPEDQRVLPLLQSIAPVVSTKRVVIKHSASVEESYEVLGRYLKMLVYDSRYSKYFLGIPGIMLALYGIFAFFHLYADFAFALAIILGGIFVIRGFSLDSILNHARRRTFFMARFFGFLASLIIGIVAIVQGYGALTSLAVWPLFVNEPSLIYKNLGLLAGTFMQHSLLLLWVAIATNVMVDAGYHIIIRSTRIARDFTALAALVLMYEPMQALAQFFDTPKYSAFGVVSLLLAGLAVLLILIYVVYDFIASRRVSANEKD